ncbi:methyltransferase-like protein 27 isoform X2 [Amphiura filiformis]|uniref:methyltransferase-like protein 27 isoform X2 n=1 Tax=Amphiura filiformis TaxID=82378 RepID=UPI003B20E1BA
MSDKFCAAKEGNYPHTVEGIKQFYDEWAPNYAKDLTHDNYTAPRWLAETIAKLVINKDANIMDMACGTGLVAQELRQHGFTNIDGVDISTISLKFSKERGIYRRLICDRIGTNKLDIQDDTYDGLVLCGSLGQGHLNQECFPELIRIVKPGGLIVFNVRSKTMDTYEKFKDGKFDTDLQELVRKGLWVKEAYKLIPDLVLNEPGHLYVYKVV